jgi:hypothetical protein
MAACSKAVTDQAQSHSTSVPHGIGFGRCPGRTLPVGDARRCQASVFVVKRGPVAAVFVPWGQGEPSIPLHEWECLEHLDGLRCELCLLFPARITGRLSPADETVLREPDRKLKLVVYGLEKILEPVNSVIDIELLSVPVNTHEIDPIAACLGAIHELFEPAPRQGRIRGRGRAADAHAGRHQVGPEI